MKPETIARRAAEQTLARAERSFDLYRRLREQATKDPLGPWSELLAEHNARNASESK